jgi:hypothetical protein
LCYTRVWAMEVKKGLTIGIGARLGTGVAAATTVYTGGGDRITHIVHGGGIELFC